MPPVVVLTFIFTLAAKALLRAHHGPSRQPWEKALTAVAATLAVITLLVFVRDAQGLVQ